MRVTIQQWNFALNANILELLQFWHKFSGRNVPEHAAAAQKR
jgi:hypothetical protein